MREYLPYLVFGIQAAAIYAIAASGLVVTYTTSGIFNFAHGSIGMMAAFTYWELRFDQGWPAPVALVVVLFVLAPLLGWGIDRVIMRGLADASTITKIVVTLGLQFFFIQAAALIWPQDESYRTQRFFEGNVVSLGDVNIAWHSLIVAGIAVAVAAGLWLLLNRSRQGVAMRAVVDDRELSRLNGIDPDRTSSVSWAIGCSLAALAGILISPIIQLDVIVLTLLVINAYAAAMVGRLRSLPLTFLGAFILGMAESTSSYLSFKWVDSGGLLQDTAEFLQKLSTTGAIPIVMLFLVLVLLPQDKAAMATIRARNFIPRPTLVQSAALSMLFVAAAAVATVVLPDDILIEVGKGVAVGVVMLSLVPLTGYAGQISLAQLAFGGVGAVAMFTWGDGGNPVGLLLAVVVSAAVGALVALPTLRLRDLYLALSTMAFAIVFEKRLLLEVPEFVTGGVEIARVSRLAGFESDTANFMLLAVAFAGVGMLVAAIRRGHFGRRLQAMKDSPAACATIGLDLTRTRLEVFALAAGIAGLGGALLAGWKNDIGVNQSDYSLFDGALSGLPMLLFAVVGGVASVAGIFLGAVLLTGGPLLADAVPTLTNIIKLSPGLAGITLGRNPDGVMAMFVSRVQARAGREAQVRVASVEPEALGRGGRFSAADIDLLDEETGLAWGRCTPVAAAVGAHGHERGVD